MAIPQVFHTVKPQDFTVTPVTVHKKYVIQRTDLYSGSLPITSSGYKIWDAVYTNEKLKLGTERTYPTNSWDGSNKHIIWKSIDAQYYRFPYDSFATFEHANERFTYKFLNYSASIFSIPQQDFGEGIQPGTVRLSNTTHNISLQDDGNGNLYDTAQSTASFAGWAKPPIFGAKFNDLFRYSTSQLAISTTILLNPYIIKSAESSIDADAKICIVNCNLYHNPYPILNFKSNGYGFINHKNYFNFDGDFSIDFLVSQKTIVDYEQCVINKNSVIERQLYGFDTDFSYSSSLDIISTNVYPFDVRINTASQVVFKRSNGINFITVSGSSIDDGGIYRISIVKTGSLVQFYQNGQFKMQATDSLGRCDNQHSIILGNNDIYSTASYGEFGTYLNNLYFYDYAFPVISGYLANPKSTSSTETYYTNVVGNVFYKSGKIVLSSDSYMWADKYYLMFNSASAWSVEFRNTHTIYQWETIVRIPKGSFNISQNPSALQNPYTDLLRNEFTGSNPNVDLYPYATTIGLYNDKKDLLAVAKLNQPLKMRDDVDMNISIKWDS